MILLCGLPSESPMALTIQAAEARGVEHLVLDEHRLESYDIRIDLRAGRLTGSLSALEREWPLERIQGVYNRLAELRDLPKYQSPGTGDASPDFAAKAAFVQTALTAWFECAPCRVVNRALPSTTAASKPYQSQRIRRSGFLVPSTLVTNDPAEVRAFQRRHRRVVYKSTDGGRSIVRELTTETAYDLERIRNLPTEFQAYVPGTDIRVHVVGSEVYATRVVSAAIDYRYAEEDGLGVAMDAHSLPNEIEARCRELSRTLELPFCGVDLRVTPNGQYHCFEVNPSPVFSDYQERTGQAIAEALVGYLAGLQENGG